METKTRKGEETKQRIIASAQKLFNKKGFEATAVREIIEDAGCAKGTFYLYFETKFDLLVYMTNKLLESFCRIISSELSNCDNDPFLKIERLFDAISLLMQEEEGSLKLLHTREMLELILGSMQDTIMNFVAEHIKEFIDDGIRRGYFGPVNPELYGKILFSIGHNLLESAILYGYPADLQTVRGELTIIVRKMLEK